MKKRVKNKEKTIKKVNKIPIGITILSVLGYIFSALFLLLGMLSLIISVSLIISPGPVDLPPDFPPEFVDLFTNNLVPLLITMTFIFIVIGIVGVFVSMSLWKGKNWARILIIIFSIFGIISNVLNIIKGDLSSIVSLAINIVVALYLLTSKEVQRYFN